MAAGFRDIERRADAAGREATELNRSIKGLSALGGIFAGTRVIDATVTAINAATQAASNLNEQIDASTVVFGDLSGELETFAAGAASSMGLAKDEALGLANGLGAMFVSMGLGIDESARLGQSLIQRAADVASLRNVTGGAAEVLDNFRSGLVGEAEPLRKYGVLLNEATVAAKANELGLVGLNGELSESAKVQARYALILEQTQIGAGNYAATADSLANQQRSLSAEFRNAQIEFGQKLLPFFRAGAATARDLIGAFGALPGPVQAAVIGLVGLTAAVAGIGLLIASVNRLSLALLQASVSARVAGIAIKTLTIGGGVLAGITLLVGLVNLLKGSAAGAADEVERLTKATDEQLVSQFRAAAGPRRAQPTFRLEGGQSEIEATARFQRQLQASREQAAALAQFRLLAEQSIGTAVRVRDALAAQGADTSRLTAIINAESAAQKRANADAEAGRSALSGLTNATGFTASAMKDLDEALSQVSDALDATLGRFIDANEAQIKLRDSLFDLASAVAEGRREDESLVRFQDRLASSTNDVVSSVEDYVLAQARAGKIGKEAADIQKAIRQQLILVAQQFPELRGQLEAYIGLLGPDVLPREIEQRILLNTTSAQQAALDYVAFLQQTIGAANVDPVGAGLVIGQQMMDGTGAGITSNLDPVVDAGRAAGAAAAEAAVEEIETTLRRSAGAGLNLAGFLIEGISLGARQAEVDLHNFLNGLTRGLEGIVADAARISADEALEILQAIAEMEEVTRRLASARSELGADSIEAKVAELELAAAQEKVNDAVVAATDSTEAYEEALKKVNSAIDAMTGSLRALQSIRDAQKAAREAQKDVENQQARLGLFERLIGEQEEALRQATARRQAAGLTAPSEEERIIAQSIIDLQNRRGEQAEKLGDAQAELQGTQLDLIESERRLIELGSQVGDAQGAWEGFFRSLALQAGLTVPQIDALVASLTAAGDAAIASRNAVLTMSPQQVNLPGITGGTAIGTATFSTQGGTQRIFNNTFNIYEAFDGRGTAVEVINDIRAVELVG